ncbi:hypothetical protein BCR37DRAFT_395701 [Protomyces lactucae-debilis]|uniref:Uncharacterized protein n=1 Tax=Protomyces lactucae-debilis TaxID=2754530 RepID=A0A1Y2EU92_PROLT|nr:uncharacterized protein BCR37DRAFT_395701 [Protomyces lactucae-debilis]ORY74854.1 hypothetical protein BCR37DRAFT_395701 [Protomyces lactucae-debilis]
MPSAPQWMDQEDHTLSMAIVTHSLNPTIGTDQKSETLYNKIYADYLSKHPVPARKAAPKEQQPDTTPLAQRKLTAVISRVRLIQRVLTRFAPYYRKAASAKVSGANESDVLSAAITDFDTNVSSETIHVRTCWRILGLHPKWRGMGEDKELTASLEAQRRRKRAERDNDAEDSQGQVALIDHKRPKGEKAAKAAAHKGVN